MLFWRADSLGRIGQAADAARELARFTEGGGHPLLGVGLVRLGWWRFRAGVPAESVDAFRTYLGSVARPAGTERDWAEAGLALALIATGEADNARDALRALEARRSPLATAVRLRLAAAALESGQVPQAQALTQELLTASLGPGIRPWVLLVKGEAHRAEGNRDEARTQFELARAVDPTSTTGRHAAFRLALTNFEMREFGQAGADLAPIVGAPAPPEMLATALILQGEAAYHAGEYAKATAAYQRVLAEIPDVPQAPAIRRALAWTALRQGQPDEARRQFVEFAQAYPADPHAVDALVLAAELALETGALEPGRELLERVVADHAGHPRADFARLNRAILLVRTGRAAAALPMLRDWIARAPFPPLVGRAWAAFGVSLLATGNSAEAASAFEHARQEGLGALAALGLGVAAVAATRLDDAAREFEAARDTGTLATAAIAEYGLAVTAFHRGAVADFRKTAETILQAAPRGPLAPGVLYVLAGVDAEARNWPAALGEAKRLVADFPAHEAADDGLERVGAAAARAGAWPVAYEAYALLRQRYPQSPFVEDSRLAWAEVLLETGRAAEARQALEAAGPAGGDPGGPAALLALGRAREATGDQAGALDAFSRAAGGGDSSGWSRPATLSYARVLGAERRWEDARRVLEPLLRVAEPAAVGEAAVAIGDTYRGEGHALAAAEYYMTAAYLAPESPAGRRALVAAGRSFAALKQPEAAAVVYQKLLAQSDVAADLAAAARQGLAEIKR
ncbi:MAG: tetratricopeptide repeat protein [Candidatus Rokubacteria bacterium]|nr:tetratricopeptide repeat protein [Candidatus Rokubacteria bacterium]